MWLVVAGHSCFLGLMTYELRPLEFERAVLEADKGGFDFLAYPWLCSPSLPTVPGVRWEDG